MWRDGFGLVGKRESFQYRVIGFGMQQQESLLFLFYGKFLYSVICCGILRLCIGCDLVYVYFINRKWCWLLYVFFVEIKSQEKGVRVLLMQFFMIRGGGVGVVVGGWEGLGKWVGEGGLGCNLYSQLGSGMGWEENIDVRFLFLNLKFGFSDVFVDF